MPTIRPTRRLRTLALGALPTLAAALVSGCGPTIRGPLARPAEGFGVSDRVRITSAASVFENPAVAGFYAQAEVEGVYRFAEATRRDPTLGVPSGPLGTPRDLWAEDLPSLSRARRTTLPNRADQILFFETPRTRTPYWVFPR